MSVSGLLRDITATSTSGDVSPFHMLVEIEQRFGQAITGTWLGRLVLTLRHKVRSLATTLSSRIPALR